MQVVILAGGFGTRLSEETDLIPKPMVRIGTIPILHHIMNYYSKYGHKDFVVALGYKAEIIVDYFKTVISPEWKVTLVDTGLETSTGGRIKRLEDQLEDEFMLTYGDGLSNVRLDDLLDHHKRFGKIATVTAVRPPARFGTIEISNGLVTRFAEKDPQDAGWINGGFFVCQPEVFNYISGDETIFEKDPMEALAHEGMMQAYLHNGFWKPMDTLRDKVELEQYWDSGKALWKKW